MTLGLVRAARFRLILRILLILGLGHAASQRQFLRATPRRALLLFCWIEGSLI